MHLRPYHVVRLAGPSDYSGGCRAAAEAVCRHSLTPTSAQLGWGPSQWKVSQRKLAWRRRSPGASESSCNGIGRSMFHWDARSGSRQGSPLGQPARMAGDWRLAEKIRKKDPGVRGPKAAHQAPPAEWKNFEMLSLASEALHQRTPSAASGGQAASLSRLQQFPLATGDAGSNPHCWRVGAHPRSCSAEPLDGSETKPLAISS